MVVFLVSELKDNLKNSDFRQNSFYKTAKYFWFMFAL